MHDDLKLNAQGKNDDNVHSPTMNSTLLGIVMAGGRSSRMGEQKPTLKVYGQDNPDMLERTSALLQKYLAQVWVSCRTKQLATKLPCVYDQVEDLGPVGGLYSSLSAIQDSVWQGILVLSCDLPFMNEDIICRLIQAREKALAANANLLMTVYRQEKIGYIESLVAIYEKPALDLFARAIKEDKRHVHQVIPVEFRHEVVYGEEESLPFFNINYPADLVKAHKLIKN